MQGITNSCPNLALAQRLKSMELSSFFYLLILLGFIIYQPSNSQQVYISTNSTNCSETSSISKGYLCNGNDQIPCQSFLTFMSRPPYDSPNSIAYLLASEASNIALINNLAINDKIPSEKQVVVPVSCSCTGSIYQHNAAYTVNAKDTYFAIATNTYQGLTTCRAVMGQNYDDPENLQIARKLMVPLRCACPSRNQTADGVLALLMYMLERGDTVASVARSFGVDSASILYANRLSRDSLIYASTPLLIPLNSQSCTANPRNFFCQCLNGSLGSFNCKQDSKNFPVKLVILLGIGIGIGLLCLLLGGYKLYYFLKKRRHRVRRERLFQQNGGFLLQQRLSSCGGGERARLFTAEELERATDNYSQSRFLGQGGFGTVYKGMLPDGSIVAVKRSKTIAGSQIEQFINEVVILSQINHRNIVKLLGCCLETEFPLLVYEFIPNGTLSNHIHEHDEDKSLSWEHRFGIASEVAGAVAYMHSSASSPIFHRDIKSSNILLDDKYRAKVSDFGTSRSIPHDRTHITTVIQGTFGYLDPEYFYTSQFTDKSDVYSFGVVLVELLTGEKAISFDRREDERNLVAHFLSLTKDDSFLHILDPKVAKEARNEDVHAVANLATRCLSLNGKRRPTMREVAIELDSMRQRCFEIDQEPQFLGEEASFTHPVNVQGQESTEECVTFSLEMESTSF